MEEADTKLQSVRGGPPDGMPVFAQEVPDARCDSFVLRLVNILHSAVETVRPDPPDGGSALENIGMKFAHRGGAVRLRRANTEPTLLPDQLCRRQRSVGIHPAVPVRGSTRRRERYDSRSVSEIRTDVPIL
jgi:hypothetical protein